MITMLLAEKVEKCGCKITFDAAIEEDDKPPKVDLWFHRICGDNECSEHPEEYFDEERPLMILETSLFEIKEIAEYLNKFVEDHKGKFEGLEDDDGTE